MKAQTTITNHHAAEPQKCLAEFLLMVINILIKIMGATTQKNKLDTLAKHHISTSCNHFTPSKPLPKFYKVFVPFFTLLTLPNSNLLTAPFSSPLSMGATTQKNKLDTLAKHHISTSCNHFTPSKPLPKFRKVFVPFFTLLTLPNSNLLTAPFSSPLSMGATTQKNKLDTLAKHHQSTSCSHFTPSKPLPKFYKVFIPLFPPLTLPNSIPKHHLAQIAFWRQRGGFNQLIGAE
jgi:hypothetical protein